MARDRKAFDEAVDALMRAYGRRPQVRLTVGGDVAVPPDLFGRMAKDAGRLMDALEGGESRAMEVARAIDAASHRIEAERSLREVAEGGYRELLGAVAAMVDYARASDAAGASECAGDLVDVLYGRLSKGVADDLRGALGSHGDGGDEPDEPVRERRRPDGPER